MGGLSEIVGIGEHDVMVGEGELHIVFVHAENIAEEGPLEFLQQ